MIFLVAAMIGSSSLPAVDVAEINFVQTPTSEFMQVVLWRWQSSATLPPDHYVSQWMIAQRYYAERRSGRWVVSWVDKGGKSYRVLARTHRVTQGADTEVADRKQLPEKYRKPYLIDRP